MLLALIIGQAVLVAANPFHKYPFVFLLDIGNEELEKTNSEQIRVSVPGGSVAIRYPAIGDGDIISHVRVSGIDFGTDLKANIVDGGPGYKYVVLVFMGNPGVAYDAVVTVQTVLDVDLNPQNIDTVSNQESIAYKSEDDENNSAEDLNDIEIGENSQSETPGQNSNAELMQPSSNTYSYADKISMGDIESENDGEESDAAGEDAAISSDEEYSHNGNDNSEYDEIGSNENEKDIHMLYPNNENESTQVANGPETLEGDDFSDNDEISSQEEQYSSDNTKPVVVDSNLYSKYETMKDHLNFQGNIYSQEEYQQNSKPVYQEDPLDYEDPEAVGTKYDDEINNRIDKYRDFKNDNYIDSDDSYAVAY